MTTTTVSITNKSLTASVQQFCTSILKKITSGEVALTRAQIIGLVGFCILILDVFVQTTIFPFMLKSRVHEEIALKKDSFRREYWSKLPFSFELRVYIFNMTNPDEIAKGEKSISHQIGPFIYESNSLSDNIELSMLASMLAFGTTNTAMKDTPALLSLSAKTVDNIGNNGQSLFEKQTAKTFLFDGQYVHCEGLSDFLGFAYCDDIRNSYLKYRILKTTENLYVFTTFGELNETDIYHGKTRIRRRTRNIMEIGDVEYNDLKSISIRKNDECDKFRGTDGTAFHSFLNKKKNNYLYVTSTFYCRTFVYKYESEIKFNGLKLLRYITSMGTDMATNDKDKCYCIARCLENGVFEIWRCFNDVFILSNPNFYLADESYVNGVEDAHPIKDQHIIILNVDPLTGHVIRFHFRIQYLFLLMWANELMILPNFITKRINKNYRMIIAKVVSYLMISIGLLICGYTLFCQCTNQEENRHLRQRHLK